MNRFSLFVSLLFSGFGFAQDPIIQCDVDIETELHDSTSSKLPAATVPGTKLQGATMEVSWGNVVIYTAQSDSLGRFVATTLPLGYVYTVRFIKEGYVTKIAEINSTCDRPGDVNSITYLRAVVTLFEVEEGVDYTFLETEPMIRFTVGTDGYMLYDLAYTQAMLLRIEEARKKR